MQKEKGMKDVISLNVRSIVRFFSIFFTTLLRNYVPLCNFDSVILVKQLLKRKKNWIWGLLKIEIKRDD